MSSAVGAVARWISPFLAVAAVVGVGYPAEPAPSGSAPAVRLASEGKGIILISSELPEILGVCDRIYVMRDGKIVGEMPASEASQEIIMTQIMTEQEVTQ